MKLEEKHRSEKEFHDKKSIARTKGTSIYDLGVLSEADHYAYGLLEKVEGKVVLELGCGTGSNTIMLAENGAVVYAIDISAGMVESTRVKARKFGRRVKILQMCAEELDFPDEMFDFVFGHSMLHHTDLELVRTQVYRVLKPGGKAVFLEPLGHNLAVNLFRKFTPGRRTSTEKPL